MNITSRLGRAGGIAAIAVAMGVGSVGLAGAASAAPVAPVAPAGNPINGPVYGCVFQTVNGHYLTAVGGGGRTTDVIHTDATRIGSWEKFTLIDSGSGTPSSSTACSDHQTPRALPHRRRQRRAHHGRDPLQRHAAAGLGDVHPELARRAACTTSRRSTGTTSPPWAAAAGRPTPSTRMPPAWARGRSSRSAAVTDLADARRPSCGAGRRAVSEWVRGPLPPSIEGKGPLTSSGGAFIGGGGPSPQLGAPGARGEGGA